MTAGVSHAVGTTEAVTGNACPICCAHVSPHRHWYQGKAFPGEVRHWRCDAGHELAVTASDVRNPPLTPAKEQQLQDFLRQQAGEVLLTEKGNKRKPVKDPRLNKALRCFDTGCNSEAVELIRDDLLWCGACAVAWAHMDDAAWQLWLDRAKAEREQHEVLRLPLTPEPVDPSKLPKRFSFSGMEKFLNCPQQWYRRYILHEPDPGGWDAVVGTFVHACMEIVVPYGRRQVDLEFLRVVARELWAAVVDGQAGRIVPADVDPRLGPDIQRVVFEERQGPESSTLDSPERAALTFKQHSWQRASRLLNYWLTHAASFGDPFLLDGKHSLEADLSCRLGDVEFAGYGDYLGVLPGGSVTTVDYKSGKAPWYAPAKTVKRHQLQLYMAAVQTKWGFKPATSQFVYANHDEVQVTRVEPAEAPIGVEKINEVWAEVQSCASKGPEAFAPTPGPLCSWCSAATTCPVGAKAVMARAKTNKKPGPMAEKLMALPEQVRVDLLRAA